MVRPYQTTVEKYPTSRGKLIYRNIASAYTDDIISLVKLDLNIDDPRFVIDEILDTYRRFSQVSGLKNNNKKTVYGTRFNKQDGRTIALNEYLLRGHGPDAGNIRHAGDELILLGHSISLLVDEVSNIAGLGNTSLRDRFQKVQS